MGYEHKNDDKGVWRTIGGRRIFIADGEDLETAMKKSGKFEKKNPEVRGYKAGWAKKDEERFNELAKSNKKEDVDEYLKLVEKRNKNIDHDEMAKMKKEADEASDKYYAEVLSIPKVEDKLNEIYDDDVIALGKRYDNLIKDYLSEILRKVRDAKSDPASFTRTKLIHIVGETQNKYENEKMLSIYKADYAKANKVFEKVRKIISY